MSATSRRRIVRRAVMALAVCLSIVAGYIGSVGTINFAANAGWLSDSVRNSLAFTYCLPAYWYGSRPDLPGSVDLVKFFTWTMESGKSWPRR